MTKPPEIEDLLIMSLQRLIWKYEDGENHNEGAYDPECPVCRILKELRSIAVITPGTQGPDKR